MSAPNADNWEDLWAADLLDVLAIPEIVRECSDPETVAADLERLADGLRKLAAVYEWEASQREWGEA